MQGVEKVTLRTLLQMKERSEKIVWVVLYDWPSAVLADRAGVDMILVGDSVAMTMLGLPNTLPITMDIMLDHARAVVRGVKRAFIVGDMPFLSYANGAEAVKNAGEFMRAGCDAVKLEGGAAVAQIVRSIVNSGIPVIGHVGLTPQSVSILGGYQVQGRDAMSAKKILDDARALEEAGVIGVLLENVTSELAKLVAERSSILTFSIGGALETDGQVLLSHDLLGLTLGVKPKFAKTYANLAQQIGTVFEEYRRDVKERRYPSEEYLSHMKDGEFEKLARNLESKA
jgi:3-methyl-2-oxobutanoate hydroxymethyltransferase